MQGPGSYLQRNGAEGSEMGSSVPSLSSRGESKTGAEMPHNVSPDKSYTRDKFQVAPTGGRKDSWYTMRTMNSSWLETKGPVKQVAIFRPQTWTGRHESKVTGLPHLLCKKLSETIRLFHASSNMLG